MWIRGDLLRSDSEAITQNFGEGLPGCDASRESKNPGSSLQISLLASQSTPDFHHRSLLQMILDLNRNAKSEI